MQVYFKTDFFVYFQKSRSQNLEGADCRILHFNRVLKYKALENTSLELNLETTSLASNRAPVGQQDGGATQLLHILIQTLMLSNNAQLYFCHSKISFPAILSGREPKLEVKKMRYFSQGKDLWSFTEE